MLQLKQYVEEQILDNWVHTKVHYFGEAFNSKNLEEWMMIRFSPSLSTEDDSRGICRTENGLAEVYTYATTLRRALELAEAAVSVMRAGTRYDVRSEIVMEQGALDNTIWYVNSRFQVRRLTGIEPTPVSAYLLDSLGNNLLDLSGNILTS